MNMKDGLRIPAAVLAIAAGAVHLAHNYLPMEAPAAGSGGPPPAAMTGGSSLMSLVMPHLSQVMLLNFVGFVGLAVLLLTFARTHTVLRVGVDVLLACMSAATLYAWNAMGRANPMGTGTAALVVETVLILVVVADAVLLGLRAHATAARPTVARSTQA